MKHVFGPVPSRRLGRSLGIDVVPPKTCSFDCLYCESGRTTFLTLERQPFTDPDEVLHELEVYFRENPRGADALTFSSAGEPSLYQGLGVLIQAIKAHFPQLPVVVLTNGSLLWDPRVRRDLFEADRVVPSLDAVDKEIFARLNRPHPDLELKEIVEGLHAFRRDYRGQFYLEILLVAGINDAREHLKTLVRAAERLRPDRIELNTVVRPPAYPGVRGCSFGQMQAVARLFPRDRTEVVGSFAASTEEEIGEPLPDRIKELLRRRPCTSEEMAASLAISGRHLEIALLELERHGIVKAGDFDGRRFFLLADREPS